jgi:pimeloyl-ACP methyl ester carboxylesterase
MGIAFDTPGLGLSDPAPAPPRIEDYAQDILSGIDALGIRGPFDLMGYHTGSMTSVALARHAPTRVRRIIMVSAPIFPPAERAQFQQYYGHRQPDAEGTHLLKRWKGFYYHHMRPGATIEHIADSFSDALLGGEIEWWGHRAAFEYELADELASVSQVVLILNPGDDLDMQTRRAQGLAANSRILEVPGWGHGFLDMHTTEAAALARAFLDAGDQAPFADVAVPPSASGPRYPERTGSFPPSST